MSDSQSRDQRRSEARRESGPIGDRDGDLRHVVERAVRGERRALEELFDRYAERVYRYALVSLRNHDDAEDVTSEVFLGVLRNLRNFEWRGSGSFESWLFRVAHNVITTEVRKRIRHPVDLYGSAEDLPAASVPGADELVSDGAGLGEVWEKVARMPRTQREVLALRYIAGLSAEEAGEVLGKSAGAVRVIQHRALAALRREMRGSYV